MQPCPPLMAPLASGCRARRSAHGVVLQRRLPTGSVHGTHRARLRTGTHKSMAPLMRVPCNAPINGRRATARSAIGVIAHRTPLVASGVPALRGVQRCGDSALRRFGASALRRFVVCGAVVMRRCKTLLRCFAVPALPHSRAVALSVCVAFAACWPVGLGLAVSRSGRSGAVWVFWACWVLWACWGVLGVLGVRVWGVGCWRAFWACMLGVRYGRPLMGLRSGHARWAFRSGAFGDGPS